MFEVGRTYGHSQVNKLIGGNAVDDLPVRKDKVLAAFLWVTEPPDTTFMLIHRGARSAYAAETYLAQSESVPTFRRQSSGHFCTFMGMYEAVSISDEPSDLEYYTYRFRSPYAVESVLFLNRMDAEVTLVDNGLSPVGREISVRGMIWECIDLVPDGTEHWRLVWASACPFCDIAITHHTGFRYRHRRKFPAGCEKHGRLAVSPAGGISESKTATPSKSGATYMKRFEELVDQYDLKWRDNRSKGGALWVYHGNDNRQLSAKLRDMGFRYAKDKGWWMNWRRVAWPIAGRSRATATRRKGNLWRHPETDLGCPSAVNPFVVAESMSPDFLRLEHDNLPVFG